MDKYKIRLTLDFTPEQLETIETFFNYNNWDFEKAKCQIQMICHQENVMFLLRLRIVFPW